MSSSEQSSPRDMDLVIKNHQSSLSDGGRLNIPMWDSSDPERAPPPLPMNPGSGSPKTRSTASPGIQAAAASLTEKMRENAPSSYTTNPMPLKLSSPEKSLVKGGQYHKRMQSLQPTSDTRSEFRNYLDNRSPERPLRASIYEPVDKSPDKAPTRSSTSSTRESGRDSPSLYVSNRYLSKPILGESTPPSATMLALQTMQLPGENETKPLNGSIPTSSSVTSNPSFDALSSQILGLTSIATNLQREMAQLSRRSKDNATDLLSLKAATNSRDEDIRKSMRDLATNISSRLLEPETASTRSAPYASSSPGYMIDSKPYDSSPNSRKSYTLPRLPSPGSFAAALERDLCASPAPMSDGSASIALLEKVLREMATKEAQEKLLELVDEVKKRPAKDGATKDADKNVTKMLEEILNLVKENPANHALVRSIGKNFDGQPGIAGSQVGPIILSQESPSSGHATSQKRILTEDLVDLLKRVKNSVAEGGGLTNEVKALVRELRGEVLGMGRDIARKLDEAAVYRNQEDVPRGPQADEVGAIVHTGLSELKEHMHLMIQEHQRELSTAVSRNGVDSTEVYTAVKTAMDEFPLPQLPPPAPSSIGMEKEDILETVREAWETYKPEIELQNFGLEREEILDCLSEGLKAYQPKNEDAVTYDQVLAAVQAGMQSFVPPPIQAPPSITQDEIIVAVKECLESFELSIPEPNLTKDDVFAAVSEALSRRNVSTRGDPESGISREDVFNAVTEGVAAHHAAAREMGESSLTREEVIHAVSEALHSHPHLMRDAESSITRDEILNAIADGLANQNSMTREIELNKEDLFEAVTAGLHEAASSTSFNVGDQVLERLQDLVQGMKDEFKQYSAASGRDTEQVLDAMKDGLEVLRGEVESYVDRAADVTGKDEIIDTVKDGFRLLQADLERTINETPAGSSTSRGNPDTPELLDAMEKEFEHLRSTLSNLLLHNSVSSEKDEILDAIRDLSEGDNEKPDTSTVVQAVKEEFENLRDTIGMSLVKSEPSDKEEIIAALRDSFETLQAESTQRRDGNESVLSTTSELLEAFNDGVDTIRADLERVLSRPTDSSNSDVLDTLREGLANIKAEMELLRESQKELDETSTTRGREIMLANESSIGGEIESLKVLIAQLQIKVEAMDSYAQSSSDSHDTVKKEHLDEVLAAVREVHGTVAEVGTREIPLDSSAARKDDTDAIETLLRNTKAQIDEMNFPSSDDLAKSEHILALEALVSEMKDAIAEVATRLETEGPTKSEIGTLETLLKDVWVAIDDLKNQDKSAEEDTDRVGKNDLQSVEATLFDVKTQIEELKLPDIEILPTKSDVQDLGDLVTAFRDKIEAEAELTAQAFEARKVEHGGLAEKIEEAKVVVAELRDEVKSKLDGSHDGLSELKTLLEGLAVASETFTTVESIKELNDLINREFERARGEQEASKFESEERDAAALVKQEETRAAIVVDLGMKMDEKVAEVLAKYDDLQAMLDTRFSEVETRDATSGESLANTKSIAEDIKLVIGAMGDSVTETCERMSDDARTFFTKVDESYIKMEALQTELKERHDESKAELEKTSAATDRVETQILEYHPQILGSIKDILLIVGQHYEHYQRTSDELKTDLSAIPASIPPLLPALPPPESREILVPEKYDDTELHTKLDAIMSHAENNNKTVVNIDKIDEIRDKVMAASREITEMVAMQSRLLVEDHERKKREAEEAGYALERRIAQKEKVEAEILSLNDEKKSLLNAIQTLKQEKEELSKQNMKLSKERSGLETALEIRHEEMQIMEDRAETLEKRILEGVLDHARTVLLSRPGSSTNGMSLKRVPSYASTATKTSRASTASTAKDTHSVLSNGVGMALKRRNPAKSSHNGSVVSSNAGKERRILSLSHVTGNRGSNDRQLILNSAGNGGLTNLKRSHSVRSNLPSRKTSWGGKDIVANKENEAFLEEDEHNSGAESDTGTERRTSYSGTYTDSLVYGTGSTISTSRQPSYSSSVNGLVGEHGGSILEEDDEDVENPDERTELEPSDDGEDRDYQSTVDEQEQATVEEETAEELSELEPPPILDVMKPPGTSDSGIGTEIQSGFSVA